ncbi:TonB-dependent receptor [Edaphobacter dinghuensis]|uniref:TonB-dependent receptor n=1 Tax=Edaphobacter dinghuensis TaxID=1560005 RepID=UPI00166EDD19|nr:TonB-dependent receptor [Edaphobacter dinghuensis]
MSVIASLTIQAQDRAALLMGTVSDPAERPVRSVQIFIVGDKNQVRRHVATGVDGYFVVPELLPGSYTLEAYGDGFAAFQLKHITLGVGDHRTLGIHFILKFPYTVVTVYGDPINSVTTVTMVDQNLIQNLPIPGRSFPSLFLLVPGVVLMPAQQSLSNDREFSFDGQPTNANYFTVDGVSMNTAVGVDGDELDLGQNVSYGVAGTTMNILPIDAIQDIQVKAGNLPSTFGRQAGGHIALTSRSGTNKFHGTASEYFRNSALDASDWFTNHAGLPRAQLHLNDFGLTLGGPLWLHDGEKHNSNYFFFVCEGLRSLQPTAFNTDVPALELRQRAPAAVQPYLNVFPLPNGPEDVSAQTATYTASNSLPASSNAFSLRIDHFQGDHLALFARYSYSPSQVTSTWTGWNLSISKSRSQSATFGVTSTLSPRTTNNLATNYGKDIGSTKSYLSVVGDSSVLPEDLLLPNYAWQSKSYSAVYTFLDSEYAVATPAVNSVRQINIVDNLTTTRSHHAFTIGGDWLSQLADTLPNHTAVSVDYLSPASVQSGIADYVYVAAQDNIRFVQHNLSLYLRDIWHSNHRWTMDYGIRWELNPAPRALDGQQLYSVSDTNTIRLANGKSPLYPTRYTDFAPRMGLTYLLNSQAGHELLLRAGAGISYSLNNTSSMYDTSTFPHTSQIGASNVSFPAGAVTLPYPPTPKLQPPFDGQFFQGYRTNYAAPKTYQWNIGLEQSFTPDQFIDVAYVGSLGRRLFVQQSLIDPNASFINQSVVSINRSDANSSYHSLQVQYKRRLSRGLEVIASYTWSHSRDDASEDIPVSSNSQLASSLKGEYGNSDFDLHNSLGTAFTYDVPSIASGKWTQRVFEHWGISSFAWTRSGMPIDVTYNDWVADLPFPMRPNLASGQPIYIREPSLPGGMVLNPDAFTIPTGGGQGALHRNSIRGLPFWQVDLGVRRDFPLKNSIRLQWRGEFINAFNHPLFGDPNSGLGDVQSGELTRDASFGQVTSMLDNSLGGRGPQKEFQIGGARSVQLAIRLSF